LKVIKKVPNFTQPGIFCEKTKHNFSTNEQISTNMIPIDSAQQAQKQKTSKNFQYLIQVTTGDFSRKNAPLNNSSSVRPISRNMILIDSTQKAEQNRNIKILTIPF
jgi:hypothetical protein